MEVSKQRFSPVVLKPSSEREPSATASQGQELLDAVVTMTGLPAEQVHGELGRVLSSIGVAPAQATLDDLRSALALYLTSFMPEEFADEEAAL